MIGLKVEYMLKAAKEKLKQIQGISRFRIIMYAGIILLCIVLVMGIVGRSTFFDSYTVISVIENNDNISENYQVIGNNFIKYSKNGASYLNKNGEPLWNQAFEMKSPRSAAKGDYIAIGDIGSSIIRVFNQSGQVNEINTVNLLENLEISSRGIIAAILSDDQSNFINLYDVSGTELVSIRASLYETGYPIDIALSDDGKTLAVSYLYIKDGGAMTKIVFYNFDATDQEQADKIIGAFEYDQLFPKIEFINDTNVVAYGESKFVIFSAESTPKAILETPLEAEIQSLFSNSKYIGFVLKNGDNALEASDKTGKYRLQVYTASGKLFLEKDFNFSYQTIIGSEEEIILYNDYQCVMYHYNGKEKFNYTFENSIRHILPLAATNTFVLIDETAIQKIKLK